MNTIRYHWLYNKKVGESKLIFRNIDGPSDMPPGGPPDGPPDDPDARARKVIETGQRTQEAVIGSPAIPDDLRGGFLRQTADTKRDLVGPQLTDQLRDGLVFPGLREIFGMKEGADLNTEQFAKLTELRESLVPLLQSNNLDKAIKTLQEFIDGNSDFPKINILNLSLVDLTMQRIDNARNTTGMWREGGFQEFMRSNYALINTNIDKMVSSGDQGKAIASFYLQTLYATGKINRQSPLFKKLTEINPEFIEKEQADFESNQTRLSGELNSIGEQLKNPDITPDQREALVNQRNTLSAEIVSRLVERHFNKEFYEIMTDTIRLHGELQKYRGFPREREVFDELQEVQGKWTTLVFRLNNELGIRIPSYPNVDGDQVIYSHIMGREMEADSGDIVPTTQENIAQGINLIATIGGALTSGKGAYAVRAIGNKMISQVFIREGLAIVVGGGTTFAVSSEVYRSIMNPIAGGDMNIDVHRLKQAIPRDMLMFALLGGASAGFRAIAPNVGRVGETAFGAGSLIGFQQGERLVSGETLAQALSHLPDDILYTLAFLTGLKGFKMGIEYAKRGEITVGYNGNPSELIGTLNKIEGVNVIEGKKGSIQIKLGSETINFINRSRGTDAIQPETAEFQSRLRSVVDRIETESPRSIERITKEFLQEGLNANPKWFSSELQGRQILETRVGRLKEQLESGELHITFNCSVEALSKILNSGIMKTKHEVGGWGKYPKPSEQISRIGAETRMGVIGLSPKYGGLGGGTEAWGGVQLKIRVQDIRDRVTFSHMDSFVSGRPEGNARNAQITLEDALTSRAILDIEKLNRKIYTGRMNGRNYTEAQIMGNVRVGEEIAEIVVRPSIRIEVENLIRQYPQYKHLIRYTNE